MKNKIKSSPNDFLITQLPQTRKDQFPFVLKNNIYSLLLIGVFLLLSFLPMIIASYLRYSFENGFIERVNQGIITNDECKSALFYLLLLFTGIEVILTFIASIGLSGANRILKLMVLGEGFVFSQDFKLGIKQNYLNTCLLFLFFGIILFLCRFISTYFLELLLGIPFYILLVIIVIPVFIIASLFSSFYEANVFQCLFNAIKLFGPYWWKFLLMSLIPFGIIYGLTYLESLPVVVSAIHIFLSLIVLPLYLLSLFELSASLFDEYINKEFFPENYRVGLYSLEVKKGEKK